VRTVTVQSIVLNAASRAGLDGSSIDNLSSTTKAIMLSNLDIHLRAAWEFFDWPDLTLIESRAVTTGGDDDIYIDKEAVGPTKIGEAFDVYRDNPSTHASPRSISFWLDGSKIRLPSDCPDTVYVRFRTTPAAEPRDPNSLVISPVTATALDQTVPHFLADFIKFELTADLQTEDGQLDKAELLRQRAETYLVSEMDKVIFQQRQPRRWSAQVTNY
jgi:hypothetical protein